MLDFIKKNKKVLMAIVAIVIGMIGSLSPELRTAILQLVDLITQLQF